MPTHKLSDAQIKICIVPKRVRWPEPNTAAAWTKAHAFVDALQDLIRSVDLRCLEAEQNRELSAGGIARRRAEICNQAMTKLASFRPFEIAEKAVTENIDALEKLADGNPQEVLMHQNLTKALKDLREGIEATKRMVMDRCKMREGASV